MHRKRFLVFGLLSTLLFATELNAGVLRPIDQFERLTSPFPQWVAQFGLGIAVDDHTLVVGARLEDEGGRQDAGAAYIFDRSGEGEGWRFVQRVVSPVGIIWEQFGTGVTLDGERIAIGGGRRGTVVAVLEKQPDGSWGRAQTIPSPRPSLFESFGRSLALEGATLVVGAPTTFGKAGSVYVYERDAASGSWSLTSTLQGSKATPEDWFGHAVALAGDRLVVGAPRAEGAGSESGLVYVFERSGGAWTQTAMLRPDPSVPADELGFSVALAGNSLVAGAPRSHRAHVFAFSRGAWVQQAELMDADSRPGDYEGSKVALSEGGRQAVVTATQAKREVGAAYVFQRTRNGRWLETWRFFGPQAREQLGLGLGFHGKSLVIGSTYAIDRLTQSGAAYLVDAPLLPEAVVDVWPGNPGNRIRSSSKAMLPIVLFTTATAAGEPVEFDATLVDHTSLRIGPSEVEPATAYRVDADHDGDLDLVVRVRVRDLGLDCGDRVLLLYGEMISGEVFFGSDTLRPVGCR